MRSPFRLDLEFLLRLLTRDLDRLQAQLDDLERKRRERRALIVAVVAPIAAAVIGALVTALLAVWLR